MEPPPAAAPQLPPAAPEHIPPPPPGFRPTPPGAFGPLGGYGARDQDYFAPPAPSQATPDCFAPPAAPPAPPLNTEDGELARLRVENARFRQAAAPPENGKKCAVCGRDDAQELVKMALEKIPKLRARAKTLREERDAAVTECDALRKRCAALQARGAAPKPKKPAPTRRKPKAKPPPRPPPPVIEAGDDARPARPTASVRVAAAAPRRPAPALAAGASSSDEDDAPTRRTGDERVAAAAAPRPRPPALAMDDAVDDEMDDVLASSSSDDEAPANDDPPPRARRRVADEAQAAADPPRKRPREDPAAVVRHRLGLASDADVADAHAYCRAILAEEAAPADAVHALALGTAFRDRRFAPAAKKQRVHQKARHAKQGQATEGLAQELRRVAAEKRAAHSAWTASRLLVELLAWARGVEDGGRKAAACLLGLCHRNLHELAATNMFELLAKAVLSWEAFRFALDVAQRSELDAAEAFWTDRRVSWDRVSRALLIERLVAAQQRAAATVATAQSAVAVVATTTAVAFDAAAATSEATALTAAELGAALIQAGADAKGRSPQDVRKYWLKPSGKWPPAEARRLISLIEGEWPVREAHVSACGARFFRAASPRDARRLSCELFRRGDQSDDGPARAAIVAAGWPAPERVEEVDVDYEWAAARQGDTAGLVEMAREALHDGDPADFPRVAALMPARLATHCRDRGVGCVRALPDHLARQAAFAATAPTLAFINLDRSTAQRESLRRLALLHGLNLQRVQAVDGATTDVDEREVTRFWCQEARDLNLMYDGQRDRHARGPPPALTPTERACAASHIRMWRQCTEGLTFILEDDVVFEADCASMIKDLSRKVPAHTCSMLLLGYFHREEKDLALADHDALLDFMLPQYFWGAHAYGLTPSAANFLLKRLPVDCPLDVFLAQAVRDNPGVLHCYAARAKVAKQRTQDVSTVSHSGRANAGVTHDRSKIISYDLAEGLGERVC